MKVLLQTEETAVIRKTKELCQTILDQPAFQEMKETIRVFLADPHARELYQRLCDKQDILQDKHRQGMPISDEEMQDFDMDEKEFMSLTVAQGFIDAQRGMHKIEESISQYVKKTFELGRVPNADDFESGSCGPSCGCH